MAKPFTLTKCTTRDQIKKQFEHMNSHLWLAFRHAEVIKNSFDETRPQHQTLSNAMFASIGEVIAYIEEAQGHF